MAGVNPSCAAKDDQRSVDGQAPTCDEETGRGRRMSAKKIVRHWMVGRREV